MKFYLIQLGHNADLDSKNPLHSYNFSTDKFILSALNESSKRNQLFTVSKAINESVHTI